MEMTLGTTLKTRISSGLGIGNAAYSGYFARSRLKALASSVGSFTTCAWAAIERPVIAIGSEVSWSILNEIRLSRARFAAFWLCGLHRKKKVRPSLTYPTVVVCGQPSGRFV